MTEFLFLLSITLSTTYLRPTNFKEPSRLETICTIYIFTLALQEAI